MSTEIFPGALSFSLRVAKPIVLDLTDHFLGYYLNISAPERTVLDPEIPNGESSGSGISHARKLSMNKHQFPIRLMAVVIFAFLFACSATAQEPILWEKPNVKSLDLYLGPGGEAMKPDLSSITFLEREKHGHNKKYRIKDGSGRIWVAKFGREARPETAAVRLLYGLGYKTEINYLVPSLTIPGKGEFRNVRLEARPENVKRGDEWKWRSNPFVGTDQLQGLKIMMIFMTNWDLLDMQNKMLKVKDGGHSETQYVISDLGATFGRFGNNDLPLFFRLGRKVGDPVAWSKTRFIKKVKGNEIQFEYKGGKSRDLMKHITIDQARWLTALLMQLDDRQIRDAFRAANFSSADIDLLAATTKKKISELKEVVDTGKFAARR